MVSVCLSAHRSQRPQTAPEPELHAVLSCKVLGPLPGLWESRQRARTLSRPVGSLLFFCTQGLTVRGHEDRYPALMRARQALCLLSSAQALEGLLLAFPTLWLDSDLGCTGMC